MAQPGTLALKTIAIMGAATFFFLWFAARSLQTSVGEWSVQRPVITAPWTAFDQRQALQDMQSLLALGPRNTGAPGLQAARDLVQRELRRQGREIRRFSQPSAPDAETVVGVVRGAQPGVILIVAPLDTPALGATVGAHTGASAPALLLGLSRILGDKRPGRSVWLAWCGDAYSNPQQSTLLPALKETGQLSAIQAVIQIGAVGDAYLKVASAPTDDPRLRRAVGDAFAQLHYDNQLSDTPLTRAWPGPDFRPLGLPCLFLEDEYFGGGPLRHRAWWYTAEDTMDAIGAESLQVMADVLYHGLAGVDKMLDDQAIRSPDGTAKP